MNEVRYKPIGFIHSPFKKPKNVPIQPIAANGVKGYVEIAPEYASGLTDIDGFSHIILIFHLHLSRDYSLLVKPFLDDKLHGVFSTRAPSRPNPIGISTVRLVRVENNILHIQDVDVVDGTPLLDIKPYVPEFDLRKTVKTGWLKKNIDKASITLDNGRFAIKGNV